LDETGHRWLTRQPGKRITTDINRRASGSVQQGLSAAMDPAPDYISWRGGQMPFVG